MRLDFGGFSIGSWFESNKKICHGYAFVTLFFLSKSKVQFLTKNPKDFFSGIFFLFKTPGTDVNLLFAKKIFTFVSDVLKVKFIPKPLLTSLTLFHYLNNT
jgi:hypothetical protein